MNFIETFVIKQKIFFRKILLNSLLLFFSPRTKFIIALSQNLDKYIIIYQKDLLLRHCFNDVNALDRNIIKCKTN